MGRSAAKAERPPLGYLSKTQLAEVFNVNAATFDKVYRRYASPSSTKDIGGKLYFHARSIIDAWAKAQAKPAAPSDDPLLAGGDSPQLERIRAAEADIREARRDEVYGRKIETADVEGPLQALAGLVRGLGESLGRRYGNDVIDEVAAVADRFDEFATSFFAERRRRATAVEPDHEPASPAATADDATVR